jgi:hypothetical protein
MVVGLLALAAAVAGAGPAFRSITVARVDVDRARATETLLLDQALIASLADRASLIASLGMTRWSGGAAEYRPGLGLAVVIGGGLYLDGWYALYLGEQSPDHGASIALNYETERLYVALRQTLRLGSEALASLTAVNSGWIFPRGSRLSANAALGLERGAVPAPAAWFKGSWRALDVLAPEASCSVASDGDGLNASIGIGCGLYLDTLSMSASWEPRFGSKSGEWSATLSADARF